MGVQTMGKGGRSGGKKAKDETPKDAPKDAEDAERVLAGSR